MLLLSNTRLGCCLSKCTVTRDGCIPKHTSCLVFLPAFVVGLLTSQVFITFKHRLPIFCVSTAVLSGAKTPLTSPHVSCTVSQSCKLRFAALYLLTRVKQAITTGMACSVLKAVQMCKALRFPWLRMMPVSLGVRSSELE